MMFLAMVSLHVYHPNRIISGEILRGAVNVAVNGAREQELGGAGDGYDMPARRVHETPKDSR